MNIKYGFAFVFVLAILLAASSLFFRSRSEPPPLDSLDLAADQLTSSEGIKSQETESIPDERNMSEQALDGETGASETEDIVEEPESNLESVFMNLAQEMAKRGYAKGLSDCIESQFRENQGIENPKDLDTMLRVCDNQFKVEPTQSQQIREVVVQAITKAQTRGDEVGKTTAQ